MLLFWCMTCHSCRDVEHLKKNGLGLPVVLDRSGNTADLFGVKRTTTTVVIDGNGVLRYCGQFRQQGGGSAEEALKAVLADMWPNLFDLFGFLKPSTRKNNPKRGGSKAKPGRAAGRNGKPPSGFVPVVEEDGIFVRVLLSPSTPRPSPAQIDTMRARATELGQAFCWAFAEVWGKIPRPDRKDLLNYWRSEPYPLHPDEPHPPTYRPVISVADGRSASAMCDRFGHELTFSASLLDEHATELEKLLVEEILACYLAKQYATIAAAQPSAGLGQARLRLRRAESAQRRFIAAVKTLAGLRALVPQGLAPTTRLRVYTEEPAASRCA